jgi:NADH-quinone oxidoreductase subunit M
VSSIPLLSLAIFAPWAGAAFLAASPRIGARAARGAALLASLSTLVLAAAALGSFDRTSPAYQFEELHPWIPSLGVHYHLGLDSLSLTLVLLTGIVAPACLVASWQRPGSPRIHGILFLLLQGAALGVFLALDFFHWFVFWELSLVPAYLLIRMFGGPGAVRAAYQFVVYTIGGSAFLLLGFAAIFVAAGTMDFPALARLAADGTLASRLASLGGFWPEAVFLGVLLGFAVKVPLFPFHTWLPSAYAEAPTGVSMFLTAILSKMGVYGFLRILWPLFPAQLHAAATPLLWLALGGAVFGSLSAMRQTDLKRMVAYSSLNHLSYCLIALFAVAGAGNSGSGADASTAALGGTILQMFNHGLSAGALFFFVGILEERSGGLRSIGDFGGVRSAAPVLAGLCGFALFSSLGLPGLNGFVGEFLIFRGVWGLEPWAAAVSCIGLLATALFLLTFWQRVFHGPRAGAAKGPFRDLSRTELSVAVPAAAFMLLLGILPGLLTGLINPLVASWASHLP